jgi:hypothetical protein
MDYSSVFKKAGKYAGYLGFPLAFHWEKILQQWNVLESANPVALILPLLIL